MSASFWKGKKVLLTGHTGFKGSWLSLVLQYLEADVLGYSLAPETEPNLFTLSHVEKYMKSVVGDIRDYPLFSKTIREFEPEIIIHLAAQSLVRPSYEFPVDTYATNVMGTVHMLEAARACASVKAIVVVTSDKCYENREWVWPYRENDPMGGHDPYSNSKGCAELVVSAYRNSFFKNTKTGVASVRAGNVIGGGDWSKDRLIPDVIRSFENKNAISLRFPKALRPWQHVLDCLNGYLLLAEKLYNHPEKYSEAWNFGPNPEDITSVGTLVDKTISLWAEQGGEKIPLEITDSALHEAHYLMLDSTKARMLLGWKPVWNIDQTLSETVKWYKAFLNKKMDMRSFTLEQIQYFINPNKKVTND